MILEDGKYYPMMKAVSGRTPGEIWTREEEMFGKLLLERLHPVFISICNANCKSERNFRTIEKCSRRGRKETPG